MITSQRTMPESDFSPDDRLDRSPQQECDLSADGLLDASELQTVLDMLAVMETADELSQLQALTEAQKRQVWEATPDALKQKLWRLRATPPSAQEIEEDPAFAAELEDEETAQEEPQEESEDEIEDLGQDLELTTNAYPSAQPDLTAAVQPSLTTAQPQAEPVHRDRSTPDVGDRMILKANSELTAAEMKAIWQLKKVQGSEGEVYDARLGARTYPLAWMVVYAKAELADQEKLWTDDPNEDEEAF